MRSKEPVNKRLALMGTIVVVILAITLVWILSSLNIIAGAWSTIISVFCTVLGVVAALLPLSNTSYVSDPSLASSHAPDRAAELEISSGQHRQSSMNKAAYRGVRGFPLNLHQVLPYDQAMLLFNLLDRTEHPRLIILDQFEHWLDWQTGQVRPDRPGISELLAIINSRPCCCRLLLTSRLSLSGAYVYPSAYLQEYAVGKLNMVEEMALLRKQGVQAVDAELRHAISYYDGHAFALTLCASLIRHHHLRLSTLLDDPVYVQFWQGNIARNLLDSMFQQLTPLQHTLLQTCSVLRDSISLKDLCAFINADTRMLRLQIQSAIELLLAQHLLQVSGEGVYRLHAIVASYVQEHIVEGDEEANQHALREIHKKAAHYYQQRVLMTSHSTKRPRYMRDLHDLLEASWHQCQAALYADAYSLLKQEEVFSNLKLSGDYATLLEFCQLLLLSEQWQPEPDQAAYLYNNLGDAYRVSGQYELARTCYQRVVEAPPEAYADMQRAWTLNNLGRIDNMLGSSQQAQKFLEEALFLFRDAHHRSGQGRVLTNLGWVYYDRGQMDLALHYFEQALSILMKRSMRKLLLSFCWRRAFRTRENIPIPDAFKKRLLFYT